MGHSPGCDRGQGALQGTALARQHHASRGVDRRDADSRGGGHNLFRHLGRAAHRRHAAQSGGLLHDPALGATRSGVPPRGRAPRPRAARQFPRRCGPPLHRRRLPRNSTAQPGRPVARRSRVGRSRFPGVGIPPPMQRARRAGTSRPARETRCRILPACSERPAPPEAARRPIANHWGPCPLNTKPTRGREAACPVAIPTGWSRRTPSRPLRHSAIERPGTPRRCS